jgi:hypothetical protein
LRQPHLGPGIDRALDILHRRHLGVEPGRMSTLATGPAEDLFPAVQEIFSEVSREGDLVMIVAFSNACPDEAG